MIEAVIAGLFGLLIGSFLNVCIYRLPRDLSVVRPRSYCPSCERQIAWYDNVPVLSFAMLGARCRNCTARIPWRYPMVEVLTGLLFFLYTYGLGPGLGAVKGCIFGALIVGLVFADLEERILPDEFTLGGALIGIALAFFVPVRDVTAHVLFSLFDLHPPERLMSMVEAAAGGAIPAGCLWAGGWLYEKVRHREGLGFGDVKMIAMVGAFLGLQGALLTLIGGSVLGSLVGVVYILATRKDMSTYELPFGTFLGVAALGVSLVGQSVLRWWGGW